MKIARSLPNAHPGDGDSALMFTRTGYSRWNWWGVMVVLGLIVIAFEVVEHRPQSTAYLDADFFREVVMFGIMLPIAGGLAGSMLRANPQSPGLRVGAAVASAFGGGWMHRILIHESTSLLSAGIQSLLDGVPGLQVSTINSQDAVELIRAARQRRPDVIILDDDARLFDAGELLAVLKDFTTLRVVAVSADSNLVRIFEKDQVQTATITDLLAVLRRR